MKILGKKVNNEIETVCAYRCDCSCHCECDRGAPNHAVATCQANTVDDATASQRY